MGAVMSCHLNSQSLTSYTRITIGVADGVMIDSRGYDINRGSITGATGGVGTGSSNGGNVSIGTQCSACYGNGQAGCATVPWLATEDT